MKLSQCAECGGKLTPEDRVIAIAEVRFRKDNDVTVGISVEKVHRLFHKACY